MGYYNKRNNLDRDYYYMTLDLQRFKKREKIKKKRTLSEEISSGYKMLIAVTITLNLLVGAVYFMINGQKTILGYKLKQLQVTSENLKDEARKIESEIVDSTSVTNIEKQAKLRQMSDVGQVIYSLNASQTAKR